MIGFYDYTVILTYLSAISGAVGIIISLSGDGHPFLGAFFLLFSGLCDAFDGKVAKTKKDRTASQMKFGIQIDSLADLIAFGTLPAAIGAAMFRRYSMQVEKIHLSYTILMMAVIAVYVLAALIRLAYYNITEEERQSVETGARKTYTGLPVTSAALIFPLVLLIQYLIPSADITPIYLAVMLFVAVAFVSKFKITKPGLRGIMIMIGIGLVEFLVLILFFIFNGQ